MILPTTPKTIYKCTRLKIYRGHSSYYYHLHCSKGPHRINVSWMLWGLSSFLAHYWPLTKWKVLESGVVKNHSFLGAGVYVWSWITKIHTLAPSRILLYTLVLQCLANACYKALTALRSDNWENVFSINWSRSCVTDCMQCLIISFVVPCYH